MLPEGALPGMLSALKHPTALLRMLGSLPVPPLRTLAGNLSPLQWAVSAAGSA